MDAKANRGATEQEVNGGKAEDPGVQGEAESSPMAMQPTPTTNKLLQRSNNQEETGSFSSSRARSS